MQSKRTRFQTICDHNIADVTLLFDAISLSARPDFGNFTFRASRFRPPCPSGLERGRASPYTPKSDAIALGDDPNQLVIQSYHLL